MCSSFIEKLADNLKKKYRRSIERVMCHTHDWTELTCTDSEFYHVAGVKSEEDQRRVLNNFCSFSFLLWISSIEAVHWKKKTCSQITSIFHVDHNIGSHLNLRLCFHSEANLVERKPPPFEKKCGFLLAFWMCLRTKHVADALWTAIFMYRFKLYKSFTEWGAK